MRFRFKYALIAAICLLFLSGSCNDVEFNDPAFQVDLNYELWRADSFNAAYNDVGDLIITGERNGEFVVLTLTANDVGAIGLGPDYSSKAEFIDGFGTVFSTKAEPDPEISIYRDLGRINITGRTTSPDVITGDFFFTAYDEEGQNPMGLSNGIFFELRIKDN